MVAVSLKKKQKESEQGEKLFEQLKKEGTLRNVEKKEEDKPPEALSPQEIIERGRKDMMGKQKEDVPSAHDLLKKRLGK